MPWSDFAPKNDANREEVQTAMLFTACESGDADRAYLVLKECTKEGLNLDEVINAQTEDGATPLFYAAKGGNLDAVNVLLKTGRCVVNKGTHAGFTPMWMAALRGKHDVLAVLLQEYGIQVDQPAGDGRTPLYAACESGNVECVRLLLKAGARPNKSLRRPDNSTPLTAAAYLGHVTIVRMLIDAGARIKHKDNDGNALDNARRQDKQEVVQVLLQALEDKGLTEEELNDDTVVHGADHHTQDM